MCSACTISTISAAAHPSRRPRLFMASNGPYDFHGTNHFWPEHGNRFNRVRIVQDGQIFGFLHDDYQRLLTGAAQGIQSHHDAGLFILPANTGFDPVKPWRLDLLVNRRRRPGHRRVSVRYKLPSRLILCRRRRRSPPRPGSRPGATPVGMSRSSRYCWRRSPRSSSSRRSCHARAGPSAGPHRFPAVVLVWLGWTAEAQLSIVNVINYIQAPFRGLASASISPNR